MITAAMLLAPVKDEPNHAHIGRRMFAEWCKHYGHVPTKRKGREWLRQSGHSLLGQYVKAKTA